MQLLAEQGVKVTPLGGSWSALCPGNIRFRCSCLAVAGALTCSEQPQMRFQTVHACSFSDDTTLSLGMED